MKITTPRQISGLASVSLLIAALSFGPAAHAQMTLDFVETDGATTASFSGSWGTFTFLANSGSDNHGMNTTSFVSISGSPTPSLSTADGGVSGTYPWVISGQADSFGGDSIGFTSGGVLYAPNGYTAGDAVSGYMTWDNLSLADLGFDAGEIASGGVLGSGLNTVTWSASVSAVPEPSTYSAIFGAFALMGTIAIRRRPRQI